MAPARTKTSFHGKIVESHAMTIGATTVPIDPPAVQRLLAVARWRFSNQTVTATICPAKIVARPAPAARGKMRTVPYWSKGRLRCQAARPCQDAQKHHLFRANPVDQDARYGIHDGVAYQEDVDDEGIAVVVHLEGRFDRRLEDRKQLAVEVIADDGDEDRHHDHPFPFFRVVQQVHACRRLYGFACRLALREPSLGFVAFVSLHEQRVAFRAGRIAP